MISERTRDEIFTAQRTGTRVGGMPVLGYDVDPVGGKRIVNEDEATQAQRRRCVTRRGNRRRPENNHWLFDSSSDALGMRGGTAE